jgi:aspartyl-tRNA(Asn)/glutamyl-tRNA(Gln) amidotransferase subunit B
MKIEPVIGLEIHVQLKTASKMFCGCENISEDRPPNTAVCPICTGHPGTLPVVNAEAVNLGIRAGLAINCTIPDRAKFDRKNYFYPDLPKGYQISQFDEPVAVKGWMDIEVHGAKAHERKTAHLGITRLHLEEDAAKLSHADDGKSSYVDYNRGGTPLAEIVTEPDFASPAEARIFLQELQRIMRAVGASDADMEKGMMRCDANISMREIVENPDGERKAMQLNPKTEVKNINSIRNVERALEYEIKRQTEVWEETGAPVAETTTRGWDDTKGVTVDQRSKEAAHDYRYFPEPDLPELDLVAIRETQAKLVPELPQAMRVRFISEYGLSREDATIMTDSAELSSYVEEIMSEMREWLHDNGEIEGTDDEKWEANKGKISKLVSGWLLSKLGGLLVEQKLSWAESKEKITAENFGEFLTLIYSNKMNSAAAQIVLAEMLATGKDPEVILEEKDLKQQSNSADLKPIVEGVINQYIDQVLQYKSGKVQIIKFLVGAVMKSTGGKANPQVAEELLKEMMK